MLLAAQIKKLLRRIGFGDCNRGSAAQVAVVSESMWKTELGGDPSVIGKTIRLNGSAFQVIGIVSSDAANFLPGGIFVPYTTEPLLEQGKDLLNSPTTPWLAVAGRLRPGFSRADTQSELSTIMSQQDRAYVKRQISAFNRKTALVLTNRSFIENPVITDRVIVLMVFILGPLTLILLLACCNVTIAPETIWESLEADAEQMRSLAGIVLIMASIGLLMAVVGVYGVLSFAVNQRRREFGIKMVLGADRGTIFRSVTLHAIRNTIFGLLCGAALEEPAMLALARFQSGSPLPLRGLNTFVFIVSTLLLAAVSLAAARPPALRATRADPMQVLRSE